MAAVMSAISLAMTVASVIFQLTQSKKKNPAQNNEAAEARKGFETVVEGQPEHLGLVYGRAKVGGIRVYHNTSSDFNFVASNADKSFGESLTPAVLKSGSYTMLEVNAVTGKSAIVSHDYTYGTSTMLDRSYTNGSRNEFLYFQQALCIGPINNVIDVIIDESRYLDDPALGTYGSVPAGTSYTADKDPSKTKWDDPSKPRSAMRIDAHYTEAGLNKADAIISQNFPDRSNAVFNGMAYISAVIRLDRDDPQFSGVPTLQFLIEGKLIRKVTNGVLNTVWEYSNNPVWCLLDYLLDTTSGGSVDILEIDLTTFEACAPIAEKTVQTGVAVGGKIWKSTDGKKNVSTRDLPLYECNIIIDTKKPVRDNVEAILATMGDARLVWSGGKYKLSLQYPTTLVNSVTNANNGTDTNPNAIIVAANLTEDDLMMDQDIEMAWPTASERLNHCIIRFNNETENFKEDSVAWPPKYSGTSLIGVGGVRYSLADYSYDEEKIGGRFLNNYGVWSTASNSTTLTYNIIVRKADIGSMTLEYTADDSLTITIYDDNNTQLYTYSKSGWETLGSQTVTLGNANVDKVYKIVITGTNSSADKAVGAKLTKGTKIIWTTRETAFSSIITVTNDNTLYQTMLLEDSNTPLEIEQFFEGATDRYHALAKAEELVRTSRTAYSIKFKYQIKDKYLEPGDFITLTSNTVGVFNEYFRINSVKVTEENTCEVQAQMFDKSHLAWNWKTTDYPKPNNVYTMSIPAPAWIVYEPSNNAFANSSGTLTWAPVSFSEFAGYVLYMYEAGGPRTSGNLPVFNEIGRAVDTTFILPKLSTSSAFFAVRSISRAGKLSNFTYSSTQEAEFFIDNVYKFEGLVLTPNSPSSNKIAWNSFNVYKDGALLKTVAAGNATWTTGVLYLYFDIKSTDANQYTVRSTTLLTDLKNNKILGTYSGGIAYTMQTSELFPPTNLHLEGRDAPVESNGILTIPFNTKDIVFSWSNALPNKVKSLTLEKYVLQFYTDDTNILKATEVITPDNKLDGQYSMSFEKNVSIFGTPTRKFKIKLFALDSAGYLSSTSLDATFNNAKPSAVTLDFTSVFNAAYLKVPAVSDTDVLKYVFKQYDSTGTVLQKTVETTSSFIDFEAAAGTTFKYTVTLCDAFGAGDPSSSVAVISASADADRYTYTGLQFTPDATTNKVAWSSFQYSKNGAALVTVGAGVMPVAWTAGKLFYLYLNTSTNTVLATESLTTAVTGRILATYKGGTELTADAGKAFISGDQLLAGTVGANQLVSNTAVITNAAQIGNVIESSSYGWPHSSGPNVGKFEGWRLDKDGLLNATGVRIVDNNGKLLFGTGAGVQPADLGNFNWDSMDVYGNTRPANNATRNVFTGDWVTATSYDLGDIVIDSYGYGWSCILAHTSSATKVPPTYPTSSNTYWSLYAVKGEKGADGAGGISAILTNESHAFPATSTGAVSSYTGSGTDIYVYEGSGRLTYNGVGTTNGTWDIIAIGTNITPGTVTDAGTYASIGAHSGMSSSVDTASIDYTITGKTVGGVSFSFSKKQTFSKSKAGSAGSNGATGSTGAVGGTITLTSSRVASFTATDGTLDAEQSSITLTANLLNITGATYAWAFSGFQTAPTASTTATQVITSAQFGTSTGAKVTCTVTAGSVTYKDDISIVRLEKSTAEAGATVGAEIGTNLTGQITSTNASTFIANAAIGSAQIGSIALVGTNKFSVKSATAGARMEMDSRAIKIYDASGILRVQLGDLSA